LTQKEFIALLAAYSAGGIIGVRNTNRMLAYAAKKGIQLAGIGARAAAPPLTRAATNPYLAGAALGGAALQTPQGQQLLEAAAEHGRQSRILFERAQQEVMTQPAQYEAAFTSAPVSPATAIATTKKRAVSTFSRAVKAGMAAVRKSTSNGKPGKITKPRAALAMVSKVISAKKKKRKAPKSGIRKKVYSAIRRFY
jgi:hypothetical protein